MAEAPAGFLHPKPRGAVSIPPSLPPSRQGRASERACRDLEPKLRRVRTPGTLTQAEPQQAPNSGGAIHGPRARVPRKEGQSGNHGALAAGSGQREGEGLGPARGPHSLEHLLGFRSPAWSWELGGDPDQAWLLPGCVALAKSLNLSEPQLSHL